jgi:dienelactone hydrolase
MTTDKVCKKSPGSWISPLTAEKMVHKANSTAGIILLNEQLFVMENRPDENGRIALLNLADKQDILPQNSNVRSRVHEYGGSCTATDNNQRIFYVEFSNQQIWSVIPGQKPRQITDMKNCRFADLTYDQKRDVLYAIMEDHNNSDLDPQNSLVKVDLKTGQVKIICQGYDFYAYPRLNENSDQIAFIAWQHPQMPWDGTELFIAGLEPQGEAFNQQKIAGSKDESVMQPEWLGEQLIYISDKNGFYNFYSYSDGNHQCLYNAPADFAGAMWSIGSCSYTLLDSHRLFVTWCHKARWKAGILNVAPRELVELNLPFSSFASLISRQNQVFFIGGGPDFLPAVVRLNLDSMKTEVLYNSGELPVSQEYISRPQSIEFSVSGSEKAQAFYYPPHNPDFALPESELPPLLIISHGGPTGAANELLDLTVQFWTTRGFAVADVNYSGSAGFGRQFRDRLKGNWGIIDVRDCKKAAQYLVRKGLADPERIAIRGGSAGGYTTLCALTFTDFFKAGASYFGLSDLECLAKETHKFESHYMDNLIGPYPARTEIYKKRSPINSAAQLSCPVIFFQGLEDKVVPPNQAEKMFEILRRKNIPTAYCSYEGEGHGFRSAQNIKHSLEAEIYFYCRVFNLDYDRLNQPPVKIHNLDAKA